jgi:ABC-2 type transport system permease protein
MRDIFKPMLSIAWKDTYMSFTDRTQLLIMLATPLLLSLIIALAFSGLGGGSITFSEIPIAIVNQDEGTILNGETLNYGQIITNILAPTQADGDTSTTNTGSCDVTSTSQNTDGETTNQSLETLFVPKLYDDAESARLAVERGDVSAAIIIPAGYSDALNPDTLRTSDASPTTITLYANDANPVEVSIVRSVLTSVTERITTGNIAIATTIDAMVNRTQTIPSFGISFGLASALGEFSPEFGCAFTDVYDRLSVEQIPLDEGQERSSFVQTLVAFGSAQAVFFALFTTFYGAMSVYDEQEQGTLQRLIVAPIPRVAILAGKLLGTLLMALLQVSLLLVALNLLAVIIEGEMMLIWGNNIALIVVLVLVIALSVAGVGVLLVGVASSPEQARTLAPIVNIGFAAIGGAFAFQLPQAIAGFSPIYWAQSAFLNLSANQTDITLNIIILLVQGVVMFVLGSWLFNRRTQI